MQTVVTLKPSHSLTARSIALFNVCEVMSILLQAFQRLVFLLYHVRAQQNFEFDEISKYFVKMRRNQLSN